MRDTYVTYVSHLRETHMLHMTRTYERPAHLQYERHICYICAMSNTYVTMLHMTRTYKTMRDTCVTRDANLRL